MQNALAGAIMECPPKGLGALVDAISMSESPIETLLAIELHREVAWNRGEVARILADACRGYGDAGCSIELAGATVSAQHPVSAGGHDYRIDLLLALEAEVRHVATGASARLALRLGVECDGDWHALDGQAERDDRRDRRILERCGIPVIGVAGEQIYGDAELCAKLIVLHAVSLIPSAEEAVALVGEGAGRTDGRPPRAGAPGGRVTDAPPPPEWMWRRDGLALSGGALSVTLALLHSESRGGAGMTQEQLAEALPISASTVRRSIEDLCRRGLVEVEREGRGRGGRPTLLYRSRVGALRGRPGAPPPRAGEGGVRERVAAALGEYCGAEAVDALVECVGLSELPVPDSHIEPMVRAYLRQLLRDGVTPATVLDAWRQYTVYKAGCGHCVRLVDWLERGEANGNIAHQLRMARREGKEVIPPLRQREEAWEQVRWTVA